MNSKRVVFLLLAVIVAGVTAFVARAWLQAERAALAAQAGVQKPTQAPQHQVLVAKAAIRVGQIVKPDDLRWQAWPAGNLAPAYVVEGKRDPKDFVGAVARHSIAIGEPVTEGRLVLAGTRGFMSAVLQPGMRAVSVPITATSAVSGFIHAGDRVDVLLTHQINGAQGQHNATETILRNARVIAMDQKLDAAPGAPAVDVGKTATLELTPKQSEVVTLALKMGDLSLVLRALQDSGEAEAVSENAPAATGDSFTHDAEVSRLIGRAVPVESPPSVSVLRGSTSSRTETDPQGFGGRVNNSPLPPQSTNSATGGQQPRTQQR